MRDLNEKELAGLLTLRGWQPAAIKRFGLCAVDVRGDVRVGMPLPDTDGHVLGHLLYQPNPAKRDPDRGKPKMIAPPGIGRTLFPPVEQLDKDATIWLVEGEPDSIAAHSVGLEATAISGTNGWKPEWAKRFADRDVVICFDCDKGGREAAQTVADTLVDRARRVRVLDLDPTRDDKYDLSDLVIEGRDSPDGVRQILETMAERAPAWLPAEHRPPRPALTQADWYAAIERHILAETKSPAWPIPFDTLMKASDGGIRPGEVWVVAGWTSNGKSILADQIADIAGEAGARVHCYLTEMTVTLRGLRLVSRRTGIPLGKLRRQDLNEAEKIRSLQAAKPGVGMHFAVSVVDDWTPAQVAADIRAHGHNIAIIDLLHGFDYRDERDLSGIVNTFCSALTTDVGDGTAVIFLAHLNDGMTQGSRVAARPRPSLASLKGASWIKQRADTVVFVWLEDDEHGVPTTDGEIWIPKNRNGSTSEAHLVSLDTQRLRFIDRKQDPGPDWRQGYTTDPEDQAA